MSAKIRWASRYFYESADDDGLKHYELQCIFCQQTWRIAIPKHSSTGHYFGYPLRCEYCNKWSKFYRGDKRA